MDKLPAELFAMVTEDPVLELADLQALRRCSKQLCNQTTPLLFRTVTLCFGEHERDMNEIQHGDIVTFWYLHICRRDQQRVRNILRAGFLRYVQHLVIYDAITLLMSQEETCDAQWFEEQLCLLRDVIQNCKEQGNLSTMRIRISSTVWERDDYAVVNESRIGGLSKHQMLQKLFTTLVKSIQGQERVENSDQTLDSGLTGTEIHLFIDRLIQSELYNLMPFANTLTSVTFRRMDFWTLTDQPIVGTSKFLLQCTNLQHLALDGHFQLIFQLSVSNGIYFPHLVSFGLSRYSPLQPSESSRPFLAAVAFCDFLRKHAATLKLLALERFDLKFDGEADWLGVVNLLTHEMPVLDTLKLCHTPFKQKRFLYPGDPRNNDRRYSEIYCWDSTEQDAWSNLFVTINERRARLNGQLDGSKSGYLKPLWPEIYVLDGVDPLALFVPPNAALEHLVLREIEDSEAVLERDLPFTEPWTACLQKGFCPFSDCVFDRSKICDSIYNPSNYSEDVEIASR